MSNEPNYLYEFDEYVLNSKERNLWRDKELVQMPAKAFDTLFMLVARHSEVLSKEEMLDEIWDGTFVEENNLSQKISILRRIFGKDKEFIETVPKKGFQFVEPVRVKSIDLEASQNGKGNLILPEFEGVPSPTYPFDPPTETGNDSVNLERSSAKFYQIPLGILLTAILGITAYLFFSYNRETESKISSASFDYVEITDTGDVLSSAISPDGKFIAFTRKPPRGESDGKTSLRLLEISSKNELEIPVSEDIEPGILKFSPDGKSIYFRERGKLLHYGNIYRISILGGDSELLAEKIRGLFSISPDGKKLVYFRIEIEGAGRQLIVKDIETGEEEIIPTSQKKTDLRLRAAPVFSPDQKLIAYVDSKQIDGNLSFINIETGQVKQVKTDPPSMSDIVWSPDGKSLYVRALKNGKSFQIWNISYPSGDVTRVTSDSDSYVDLNIASDGTISVNRINMYCNLWLVPDAKIENARQLTKGENGLSGLITAEFIPTGKILFNSRDKYGAGIRVFDLDSNIRKPLSDKRIRTEHYFSYSKKKKTLFFELENRIWQRKFDGSEEKEVDLGEARLIRQPAVSHDENWLYYVKRGNGETSILRSPINDGREELVLNAIGFSPDTFLSASPDGRYLAFEYVKPEKRRKKNKNSRNSGKRFGFLDLQTKKVKVIEVPAYNPLIRWSKGGKSFDFCSYTKIGTAILRKDVDGEAEPTKVFEIEDEIIYRFDWSPNGEDLAIGRGNYSKNLVLLKPQK